MIKGKNIRTMKNSCFFNIHKKAVFDVPNSRISKYRKMLKEANSWDDNSIKVK